MNLKKQEKKKLIELSEIASDLLVEIMDEKPPQVRKPTKNEIEFQKTLHQIYNICPLLFDSYILMYNNIQKEK